MDDVCYEIYGECVSLRELGLATLLSTVLAFALYFTTPYIASALKVSATGLSIVLGAIGATIGFVISSLITRVKRVIVEV